MNDVRIDGAIVGVHRCGTTALLEMLRQHPDLVTHPTGQWPGFLADDNYRDVFPRVIAEYLPGGRTGRAVLIRDMALYLDLRALARLIDLSPAVRLVLSLKDPVERAYSAFCYARSRGFERETDFAALIAQQRDGGHLADGPPIVNYIRMGLYHRNLEAICNVIPRDRVLILRSRDLKADPVGTCQAVFRFLQLPSFTVTPVVTNQTRRSRATGVAALMRRDFPLKAALKAVLPLRVRRSVRRLAAGLNVTDRTYPPLNATDARALRAIFQDDARRLHADYGIDVSGVIA